MEGVKELKEVLDKVEKKLMATFHIYTALIYSAWLAGMGGYLLVFFLAPKYTGIYWPITIALIILVTVKVYNKYLKVEASEGKVSYGWIIGWIIGGVAFGLLGDARGLASMIALGHLGMYMSFRENSMLIPLLVILTFVSPTWELATALIILTYSVVTLINLYKTFRVI
ncbi:hypothetical protein PFDSM3638_05455 [Pyrococcus furiosus DSM 3638]|uniref:Uncharacterized protein n=3 Tax=Pyrococcus furiosus TaxID=2261 RepID=A0A5C0XQD9_PYRFU|nr:MULTISPECIES: hypothetical protein [Pyrococcus]AAL81213.1 hypothetical protein PF1089 [Pyrococcus furiosus DSM 3638]AFN03881.1 hypothetical protein PFC_04670 [Pyrococcus furiosus COM1]MDK2868789.1 hypothetical protein [Pyrococcus sp.]QEK78745.1 hypothetical protein PFDSM3638_05455 [Pyrococcus furiosus DSM 3638]